VVAIVRAIFVVGTSLAVAEKKKGTDLLISLIDDASVG
jgi:hypothetical protein